MNLLRASLLGLALALPAATFAQWQWIDKDGRKVFSDQSPPADIPAKNILKQPGARNRAGAAVEPAASAPAQAAAPAPKLSGKDKALEDKRKQAESVEAEKKKAEEEELARKRADNCALAKSTKANYDSGVRITRMNAKGEREFLDDAQRADEVKRIQGIIDRDCKPLAQ